MGNDLGGGEVVIALGREGNDRKGMGEGSVYEDH